MTLSDKVGHLLDRLTENKTAEVGDVELTRQGDTLAVRTPDHYPAELTDEEAVILGHVLLAWGSIGRTLDTMQGK